jgi:hypothetical protein
LNYARPSLHSNGSSHFSLSLLWLRPKYLKFFLLIASFASFQKRLPTTGVFGAFIVYRKTKIQRHNSLFQCKFFTFPVSFEKFNIFCFWVVRFVGLAWLLLFLVWDSIVFAFVTSLSLIRFIGLCGVVFGWWENLGNREGIDYLSMSCSDKDWTEITEIYYSA